MHVLKWHPTMYQFPLDYSLYTALQLLCVHRVVCASPPPPPPPISPQLIGWLLMCELSMLGPSPLSGTYQNVVPSGYWHWWCCCSHKVGCRGCFATSVCPVTQAVLSTFICWRLDGIPWECYYSLWGSRWWGSRWMGGMGGGAAMAVVLLACLCVW